MAKRRVAVPKVNWEFTRQRVYVTCPGCGMKAGLDHTVEANGDVNPSLDCPECSYHVWASLEGWDHGRVLRKPDARGS